MCPWKKHSLPREQADVTSGNESITESWINSISELESFFVFSFSHNFRLPGTVSLGVRCLQFPLCPHTIKECCFYSEFESWWASVYVTGNSLRQCLHLKPGFNCISIQVLNISDKNTCKQKEVYSVLPFPLDVFQSNCLHGRDCKKFVAVSYVDTFIPDCCFSSDICTWILTKLV